MNANEAQYLRHQFTQAVKRVGRHHAPSYHLSRQLPGITAERIIADRKLTNNLDRAGDAAAAWRQAEGIVKDAASWNRPLDVDDVNSFKYSTQVCVMLVHALHEAALGLDRQLGLAPGTDGKCSLRIPGNKASIAKVLNYADRADLRAVALAQSLRNIHACRGTRILDRDTDLALAQVLYGTKKRREARIALRSQRVHVGKLPLKPGQVKVRFDTGLVAESLPDEIEVAECEKCGASMTERARRKGAHYLSCGYCGHKRELAAPAARITVAQDLATALAEQRALLQPLPDMVGWRCDECGAEAVTGASGIVARCAYCGSTHFTRIEGEGVARPQGMLRFACDQDRAEEMIREYLHAQGDVEYGFARDFEVETAQARYVPYWVFNLTEPFGNSVSNVCSCASRQLLHRLPAELRAIEPFPIAALPPFESSHLVGTVAERYSVNVEEALAHSFKLGGDGDRSLAGVQDLPRGTSVAFRYVLVPVWFFVLRWKGVEYHALVDGSGAGVGIRYPKTRARAVLRRIPTLIASAALVPGLYFGMQYLQDLARYRAESQHLTAVAAEIQRNLDGRAQHLAHEQALREQAGAADGEEATLNGNGESRLPATTRYADTSFELPVRWQPEGVHAMQAYTAIIRLRYSVQGDAALATAQAALAQGDLRNALKALLQQHAEDLYLDRYAGLTVPRSTYWLRDFEKAALAMCKQWRLAVERDGIYADLIAEYLAPPRVVYVEGSARNLERRFILTLQLPEADDRADWIRRMSHGDLLGEIEREIAKRTLTEPRREHLRVAREAATDALRRWFYMRHVAEDAVEVVDFEVVTD